MLASHGIPESLDHLPLAPTMERKIRDQMDAGRYVTFCFVTLLWGFQVLLTTAQGVTIHNVFCCLKVSFKIDENTEIEI